MNARNKASIANGIPAKYCKTEVSGEEVEEAIVQRFDNSIILTFREVASKGICGCDGSLVYPLSDVLPYGEPAAGEVWKCLLDNNSKMLGTRCMPIEYISTNACEKASVREESDARSEEIQENIEDAEGEIETGTAISCSGQTCQRAEVQLRQAVKDKEILSRENADMKGECASLRSKLAESEKNNQSLRQQIRLMNHNTKTANLEQMKSQIENKDSEIEKLRHEVERYKSFIEANHIDMINVDSDRGKIFQTMMTSPSRIHSTAFGDGKYTVQIGRAFSELRFIPDVHGNVVAVNGDIELPGLARFASFEQLKKLNTRIDQGAVTISN